MAVRRRGEEGLYHYRIKFKGREFSGNTGQTNERDAKKFEAKVVEELKKQAALGARLGNDHRTIKEVSAEYWTRTGQFTTRPGLCKFAIMWIVNHFGPKKQMSTLTDDDVSKMVAARRGEPSMRFTVGKKNKKIKEKGGTDFVDGGPLAAGTINRTTTEPMRRLYNFARDVLGEPVRPITWKKHILKEPKERVRFLSEDEENAIFASLHPAHKAIVAYSIITACRAAESVRLRWCDINWGDQLITVYGKGKKIETIPMSDDLVELLSSLKREGQKAEDAVFRKVDGKPVTYPAFYTGFKAACRKADVPNMRVHDLRHTAATRIVRESGNLKTAQILLRHEDIATTSKYAHVLKDDVRDAMNAIAKKRREARLARNGAAIEGAKPLYIERTSDKIVVEEEMQEVVQGRT